MADLIYGQAFCHESIVLNFGTLPLVTLKNIRWKKTKIKNFNYGTGAGPVSWGTGNREPVEVTFQISKSEHVIIQNSASLTNGDILELAPIDIPVTNELVANPRLDIIKHFLLQSFEESSEQGNTDIMMNYVGIAADVVPKI